MNGSLKRNITAAAVLIAITAVLFFGSRVIRNDTDADNNGNAQSTEAVTSGGAFTEKSDGSAADGASQNGQQEFAYNFRRSEYLTEHFEKHGGEFGYNTEQEYLEGANRVITAGDSLCKTEAEDGDFVFFQESTGSIVFVSADGYIRTYFKPTDGIDYYNRQ